MHNEFFSIVMTNIDIANAFFQKLLYDKYILNMFVFVNYK